MYPHRAVSLIQFLSIIVVAFLALPSATGQSESIAPYGGSDSRRASRMLGEFPLALQGALGPGGLRGRLPLTSGDLANRALGRKVRGPSQSASMAATTAGRLFRNPVAYDSGGVYPYSIAVGDVNGDGKLDLLVANLCADNSTCPKGVVGVLLGNGDGTFQPAVSYSSGGDDPVSVAVGDVNGDGKLDLVVANGTTVDVLLGNGDGTFQTATSYGAGGDSVAVGDVNGDGKLDLVVANGTTVDVLLGNGDGTFQTAASYGAGGNGATSVVVADVNGDGQLDLLVANLCVSSSSNCTNGSVGVLLGNGDGTFQTAVAYDSGGYLPFSVTVGDVNGDGKLDLLVANWADSTMQNSAVGVLVGRGDGTFRSAISYHAGGVGALSVAAGDVNGDGNLDLVVANQCDGSGTCNGSVEVLLGNGDGTFRAAVGYNTGGSDSLSVAIADVNGDGKMDLLVTNECVNECANGTVGVLLNKPATECRIHSSTGSFYKGQKIKFTAQIAALPPGAGIPSGKVTFWDSAYSEIVLGTAPLIGGKASITSVLYPDPSRQYVKAVYKGDSSFAGCESEYLPEFYE